MYVFIQIPIYFKLFFSFNILHWQKQITRRFNIDGFQSIESNGTIFSLPV